MEKPKPNVGEILKKSAMRALGGGISGAAAMGINVGALMWLRTTVNYQYRNVRLHIYLTLRSRTGRVHGLCQEGSSHEAIWRRETPLPR